jgi:uncharacterized protein (DUF2132 family)
MADVGRFFLSTKCLRYAARLLILLRRPPMTESPKNPLHGVTLEALLTELVAHYGWDGLAQRVDIRCFKSDPSIKSSLTFLRKTPWAREKVETLYVRLRQGRG